MTKAARNLQKPAPANRVSDATLRGFVGYNLKRAFNVMRADLSRVLQPFGLRMLTYTALVLIVDNPGARQAQLADAMDMERPNMVDIIDQLERLGLIVRDRVPTDRRAYALNPTDKGRRVYAQAVEAVTRHETLLTSKLDETTRRMVISALRQIEIDHTEGTG